MVAKTNKSAGLYAKYNITKTNGSDIDPNAEYFILRLDSDGEPAHVAACKKALAIYADEIESTIPELAKDIRLYYQLQQDEKSDILCVSEFKLLIDNIAREVYCDGKGIASHNIKSTVTAHCEESDQYFDIIAVEPTRLPGCGCWRGLNIKLQKDNY